MYIAVIADIVASRSIEDRYVVQKALKDTLDTINKEYAHALVSPFTLTLGDEFQGLLSDVSDLFEIIDLIRFEHVDIGFRFGIGIGEILTEIDPQSSLGADGPAYWNARKALKYVHDCNDYGATNMRIESVSVLALINDMLRLCGFIESRWRTSQRYFVMDCIQLYGYSSRTVAQKELAKELDISPQLVNQRIRRSGLYQYLDAKQALGESLQKYLHSLKNQV